MNKYTGILMGGLMLALIAFKPWHVVNRAVGLEPGHVSQQQSDSINKLERDSLFLESVPLVLAGPAADTLASQVEARQRYHDYLVQEEQKLAKENAELAARKLLIEQKIAEKKKLLVKEEQHLVSISEVQALVSRQKKPPLRSDRVDSRTGLLKEGDNHP